MYENINNFAQKRVEADYRQSDCHELKYIRHKLILCQDKINETP